MGLDVTHLNKIERGVINVTFGTLVSIAEGLGETLGALFAKPRPNKKGSANLGTRSGGRRGARP